MIQKEALQPQQWTKIGTGPHAVFWAMGRIRVAFGDAAPADAHTSLLMAAHGQPKSLTYSGQESVWIMPVESVVHVQLVQISASELFLVDSDGNVLVDGSDGGVI